MRSLPLVVLTLIFLALAPAYAQPPAPAPAPVPNDPQAVTQEFLRLLPGLFMDEGKTREALAPLVLPGNEPEGGERGPGAGEMIYVIMGLLSMTGAQPAAGEIGPDGRMILPVQAPPLKLVLVPVEGKWKVDLEATWALMPEAVRAVAEGPARARAEQEACLSNLKQLALAALMFAQDHDDTLPSADKWTDEIMPYLKNEAILRCPAAPELECGYALNRELAGKNVNFVANPAEGVLFFESNLGKRNATGTLRDAAVPGRHNGGNNYAFADAHCKWMGEPPGAAPPLGPAPGAGGPPPEE